jgi:hypothetical protein
MEYIWRWNRTLSVLFIRLLLIANMGPVSGWWQYEDVGCITDVPGNLAVPIIRFIVNCMILWPSDCIFFINGALDLLLRSSRWVETRRREPTNTVGVTSRWYVRNAFGYLDRDLVEIVTVLRVVIRCASKEKRHWSVVCKENGSSRCIDKQNFVYRTFRIWISAQNPATLTDVFRCFSHSIQASASIVL